MEKQQGKYVINREKGLANQVSTYSKQTTRNQVVDPSSRADRQKLYYSFFWCWSHNSCFLESLTWRVVLDGICCRLTAFSKN